MQNPASSSTLELVVNEQQMQNMSQINLRPSLTESNQKTATKLNNFLSQPETASAQQQYSDGNMFSFEELKRWPTRFRDNLQLKLDEAKSRSETRGEYIVQVMQAFSGIFVWILCFVFTIIVPIFLFFLGLTNLDDCADRPSLPYLILTMGFLMTASNLFNFALTLELPILANHKSLSNDVKNIIASIINIIFHSVVALLYILSAYMVYRINGNKSIDEFKPEGKEEINASHDDTSILAEQIKCSSKLYGFTYWFITLTLGSIALIVILASLMFAYNRYRMAIIRGSTPRSHQATNSTPTVIINNRPNNGNQ